MNAATLDWTQVHAALHSRVRLVARSVLRDEHEAEDAVQETFLRAWMSISSLRDPAAFSGWVLRLARNAAFDRVRKRRPQPSEAELDHALDHREDPPGSAMDAAEAMSRLSPALTVALIQQLRGLTLAEAAEESGISYTAAKTRLSRARGVLRKVLA